MELIALWISILFNAILVVVLILGALELRKSRDRMFRKDGYIRHTKAKLEEAREEIHRKETVILREKGKGKWTIQFFTQEEIDKGVFKNHWIFQYRFQLMHNGFPVGPSGLIRQNRYAEVDKDQINRMLEEFAKPLLEAGIDVAVRLLPV